MTAQERWLFRLAVLSDLVQRAPGRLGRTAIMKLAYFRQTVKEVPLGYNFRLYTYGPYDGDVLTDLSQAEAMRAHNYAKTAASTTELEHRVDRLASSSKVCISRGDHEVCTKTSVDAAFTSPRSPCRIQKWVEACLFRVLGSVGWPPLLRVVSPDPPRSGPRPWRTCFGNWEISQRVACGSIRPRARQPSEICCSIMRTRSRRRSANWSTEHLWRSRWDGKNRPSPA